MPSLLTPFLPRSRETAHDLPSLSFPFLFFPSPSTKKKNKTQPNSTQRINPPRPRRQPPPPRTPRTRRTILHLATLQHHLEHIALCRLDRRRRHCVGCCW